MDDWRFLNKKRFLTKYRKFRWLNIFLFTKERNHCWKTLYKVLLLLEEVLLIRTLKSKEAPKRYQCVLDISFSVITKARISAPNKIIFYCYVLNSFSSIKFSCSYTKKTGMAETKIVLLDKKVNRGFAVMWLNRL